MKSDIINKLSARQRDTWEMNREKVIKDELNESV